MLTPYRDLTTPTPPSPLYPANTPSYNIRASKQKAMAFSIASWISYTETTGELGMLYESEANLTVTQ
jgi:hypothetical protein